MKYVKNDMLMQCYKQSQPKRSSEGKVVERVTNKHQPLYKTHENEIGTVCFEEVVVQQLCSLDPRPLVSSFF